MKIVLYQPKIPQNTGNIVRTCSVTGVDLVLVEPLGFDISDKALRRAGLDYWNEVEVETISDLDNFLENYPGKFYFFSSKASKNYSEIKYKMNDLLIFGSETSGLPDHLYDLYPDKFVTMPMLPDSRCLNLSNAAAIAVYEAWRQNDFILKS